MKLAIFHNLSSGGALKALWHKARGFKIKGHCVNLYSFSTAQNDFPAAWDSVVDSKTVMPLDFRGWQKHRNYFNASKRLADMINASDVDFALVDKCRFFGSPSILRFLKKPYIFYSHEPLRYFEYERLSPDFQAGETKKKLLSLNLVSAFKGMFTVFDRCRIMAEDRRNICAATQIMTNSEYTREWLKAVYDVDAIVNYQGVDSGFFSPDPSFRKERRVLSVGRLSAIKGYDFILDVLKRASLAHPFSLDIVCDEIDHGFFYKFQKKTRCSSISFKLHRNVSEVELRRLYRRSFAVLCASRHEPFGLVPLEAFACGTPVLALSEGGYKETVSDGKNGFLLKNSASLWAACLESLDQDPAKYDEICTNARREALEEWRWEFFINRFESIARKLISLSL